MPDSFEACCSCPHYDNCNDKRELKRVGIIWLFAKFIKGYLARIRQRKAVQVKS